MCRLSAHLGSSNHWHPQGLSRPVIVLLYLYSFLLEAESPQGHSAAGRIRSMKYSSDTNWTLNQNKYLLLPYKCWPRDICFGDKLCSVNQDQNSIWIIQGDQKVSVYLTILVHHKVHRHLLVTLYMSCLKCQYAWGRSSYRRNQSSFGPNVNADSSNTVHINIFPSSTKLNP